jgi:anti-sigma B factor antagonist
MLIPPRRLFKASLQKESGLRFVGIPVMISAFVMPITKKTSAEFTELFVSGRIDGAAANELEIAVLEASRSEVKTVYVNLAEATFLCSAGLRVLLQYWRQMKKVGKSLVVANPSPDVDSVLTMTGFREQMVQGAAPRPG